jgi:predicted dehydrogenase
MCATSKESQIKDIDIPEVGIGMLGASFMGKAHSNGYKQMSYIFWPPPAIPKLVKICGIPEKTVANEAKRFGYESYTTNWHDLITDDRIVIFDNCGPNNLHAEPCIAAAQAGKHIICEKPLARNSEEARRMLDAVNRTKVKHICAQNYRLLPATILAKKIIDEGRIGKIFHFMAIYQQDWIVDPNFPFIWKLNKELSGSGALGDLGTHIIDLSRFLCGEPGIVSAIKKTFIKERRLPDNPAKKVRVDVDDAFVAAVEFRNGAIGFYECSRFCPGRKNYEYFEINGEKGSLYFNLENLNYLYIYFKDDESAQTAGFHKINVTESYHPYIEKWWPAGHIIGWENLFVHEAYHIIDAAVNRTELAPMVATFEDGYKNAVVCDAILKSAETGQAQEILY